MTEESWHTVHKMHFSSCWFSSVTSKHRGAGEIRAGLYELRQRTFQVLQLSQVLRYFLGRELSTVLVGEIIVSQQDGVKNDAPIDASNK